MTLTEVYEIQITGLVGLTGGGSKRVANVFHYTHYTTGTPASKASILSFFLTNVWNQIGPLLSVDYVGESSAIRIMDDPKDQFLAGAAPDSGAVTGDRLPNDMAAVFLLRTAQRGRNFRGSKHFGPIAESATTKDELSTAAVTAWGAVATALGATMTVSGEEYRPCVLSKTLSDLVADPSVLQGSLITQALLNKTIGTMRRRREKTIR